MRQSFSFLLNFFYSISHSLRIKKTAGRRKANVWLYDDSCDGAPAPKVKKERQRCTRGGGRQNRTSWNVKNDTTFPVVAFTISYGQKTLLPSTSSVLCLIISYQEYRYFTTALNDHVDYPAALYTPHWCCDADGSWKTLLDALFNLLWKMLCLLYAQWPFATEKCESTYFLSIHLKRTIEINYLLLFF